MVGWPDTVPAEFKPYQSRLKDLSTLDSCVLWPWGARVVVPPQLLYWMNFTRLTLAVQASLEFEATPGGQRWTEILKILLRTVRVECARRVEPLHQSPHYILGNGPVSHGVTFISILLDRTWDICILIIVDDHSKWLDAHIDHVIYYIRENHRDAQISICQSWPSTDDSYGQWILLH